MTAGTALASLEALGRVQHRPAVPQAGAGIRPHDSHTGRSRHLATTGAAPVPRRLTLALGIWLSGVEACGAVLLTVANAGLLRPLPFPESERLVLLRPAPVARPPQRLPMSDALHFLYAAESRTLDSVVGFTDVAG